MKFNLFKISMNAEVEYMEIDNAYSATLFTQHFRE